MSTGEDRPHRGKYQAGGSSHPAQPGTFELGLEDDGYPQLLRETPSPPKRLFGRGDASVLCRGGLAVVGARRATPYGTGCAEMFSARAAALGVVIISGGAIGCDQAATRAALAGGAPAVIVLGCGPDVVYPKTAGPLIEEVLASGGAVVSENPPAYPPLRDTFVRRNRIISGLADATLIVEAGLPSGTFSTADAAIDAGRELLVVPGSIHSRESRGSNRLIAQGATPIVDMESFDDALRRLFGAAPPSGGEEGPLPALASGLAPDKAKIVSMLAASPMRPNEIIGHSGMPANRVLALISELESFGFIERFRDGRYGVPVIRRRMT